ncbi:hypothetical protein MGG_15214 [Pyricularia oryzae 70-15]|uniref:Uncharacterized protein n=2 Tax=Pyricularia oryzae TaxID=318829 RepID=G4N310_PYRO7|nr:uncharacterized protein MGG_15214 [Pyricularia oryzae 70-15]EHA51769.1 hypothetical protein MGG_15214 [Pyricularia oryzae 70-15]KAI7909944.1 hypothetical protein M0657_011598 [Pyricularia oryzae]KAI7910949.1 hypothetical protein M9X92_010791 [Pyricularia oryzae]
MSTPTPTNSPTSSPTKAAPCCGPTPTNSPATSPKPRRTAAVPTPNNCPTPGPKSPSLSGSLPAPKPGTVAPPPTPSSSPTRRRMAPCPPPPPSSPAAPKTGRVTPPPRLGDPALRERRAPPPAPPPSPAPPTAPRPWKKGVRSDEAIRMAKKHFGAQWEGTTEERLRRVEAKRYRRWLGAAGRPAVPDKRRRDSGAKVFLRGAIAGWRHQRLREGQVDEVRAGMGGLELMEE